MHDTPEHMVRNQILGGGGEAVYSQDNSLRMVYLSSSEGLEVRLGNLGTE